MLYCRNNGNVRSTADVKKKIPNAFFAAAAAKKKNKNKKNGQTIGCTFTSVNRPKRAVTGCKYIVTANPTSSE